MSDNRQLCHSKAHSELTEAEDEAARVAVAKAGLNVLENAVFSEGDGINIVSGFGNWMVASKTVPSAPNQSLCRSLVGSVRQEHAGSQGTRLRNIGAPSFLVAALSALKWAPKCLLGVRSSNQLSLYRAGIFRL